MRLSTSRTAGLVLTAVFLAVVLRPHPPALGQLASVYAADAAILAIGVGWILALPGRLVLSSASRRLLVGGLGVIAVLVGITGVAVYGSLRLGATINVMRFGYYIFLLILTTGLAIRTDIESRAVRRLLDGVFFVNLVIVALQALDPPLLGELVRSLYGSEKLRSLATGYPRVYGSFFNANWFGAFLVFNFLGWLWLHRCDALPLRGLLVRSAALAVLVLLSGSRTGVIGLGIGVLGYFAIRRRVKPVLLGLLLVGGGALLVVELGRTVPMLETTLGRFADLANLVGGGDVEVVASLAVRVEQWREAAEAVARRPWLGYGDSGLGVGFIPHNSVLALLLAFGAVGGVAVGCWFLGVFAAVWSVTGVQDELVLLRSWFVNYTIALLAMAQAADFINTSQVTGLWLLLAGACLGQVARAANGTSLGHYDMALD